MCMVCVALTPLAAPLTTTAPGRGIREAQVATCTVRYVSHTFETINLCLVASCRLTLVVCTTDVSLMCVCIFVCMCVSICAIMSVCICVCMCECIHTRPACTRPHRSGKRNGGLLVVYNVQQNAPLPPAASYSALALFAIGLSAASLSPGARGVT